MTTALDGGTPAITPLAVYSWIMDDPGSDRRPPELMPQEVIAKRNRAGKRGLILEISEDLPPTWGKAIPVVLATPRELG